MRGEGWRVSRHTDGDGQADNSKVYYQGRDIDCFRTAPVNTIVEQARFLTAHGLTTPGLAPAR